jgi:ParB/RepB/Spo0J family partition protein
MTATAQQPAQEALRSACDTLRAAGWTVPTEPSVDGIWECADPAGDAIWLDAEWLLAAAPLITTDPAITAEVLEQTLDTPSAEAPLMTVAELDQLAAAPAPDGAQRVPLARILDNPYQTRLTYDDERIAKIAASIEKEGLHQTPVGRLRADGMIELMFGHTRRRSFDLLAAKDPARWGAMPVVVRELDDEAMATGAWTENNNRKDLTPYEEAMAIQSAMAHFGWTQVQAAEKFGLDRSTIANKLRLLKLPPAALQQLRDGKLSERQAMAVLPLAELPAEVLGRTDAEWRKLDVYMPHTAGEIITRASEMDSATLRREVDQFLERVTITLQKHPWATLAVINVPVHAPLCKDCPIRLKSSNRCPDKACAGRKQEYYGRAQASLAAASVKLRPLARPANAKPYQDWCDGLQGVQRQAIKDMAAQKQCGNLGVVFETEHTWSYGQKLDKYPNCFIVCGHGVGKRCACKAALARNTDRPEASEEAKKRLARKRIREELLPPAEAAIRAALEAPTAQVWRVLFAKINYGAAQKLPADADSGAVLAALARELVSDKVKYSLDYYPDGDKARKELEQLLGQIGAWPPPWPTEPTPPADVRAQTPDESEVV